MRLFYRPQKRIKWYCLTIDKLIVQALIIKAEVLGIKHTESTTTPEELMSLKKYLARKFEGKYIGAASLELINAMVVALEDVDDTIKIINEDLDFLKKDCIIDEEVEEAIKEYFVEKNRKTE